MLHLLASTVMVCVFAIGFALCQPPSLTSFFIGLVPTLVLIALGARFAEVFRAQRTALGKLPEVPLFGRKPFWLGASERARGTLSMAKLEAMPGALSVPNVAPAGALSEAGGAEAPSAQAAIADERAADDAPRTAAPASEAEALER